MKLFISPHNDDAVLFGTFTLLRERPNVVVVFDSYVQPGRGYPNTDAETRRAEDIEAISNVLECPLTFLRFRDDAPNWPSILTTLASISDHVEQVWAPAVEPDGHAHHNAIGQLSKQLWNGKVQHYATYTRTNGKSKGQPVEYQPEWVEKKLKALACYKSQICLPNCVEHFIRPQNEFYL